jgi:hypothetical protein
LIKPWFMVRIDVKFPVFELDEAMFGTYAL